ncbi:unnamed protein product [Aphanomyces euteiches]|nr:hypothetical protein Ae201684P_004761 [Aphanomyces euteiches]
MTPQATQAAYSQHNMPPTPQGTVDSRAKLSEFHRKNIHYLVLFLVCSTTCLLLVNFLVLPVSSFKEAPPSYSTAACDACGLLNTTKKVYSAQCEGNEPCCPTTLFPTGPVMTACTAVPSCCCPHTVSRRGQDYNLNCPRAKTFPLNATSSECICEYWNAKGDSFGVERAINFLLIMVGFGLVLVISCIWGCVWACQTSKMNKAIESEQGNRQVV